MLSFSLFNTINWWNLKNVYNKFNFVCKKKVNWGKVMEFKLLWKRSNEVVIFRLVFSSRIQTSDKQLISCDFFLCSPQKQLSMSWETHNFKQKTLINQTVRSYHNRHRVNVRIRLLKKSHLPLCQWRKMTFLTFLCCVLWCQFVLISTKHLSKYLLNL